MNDALVARFGEIVGSRNAVRPPEDMTHYTVENRGIYVGKTPVVLKPASTEQVSQIMQLATQTKTGIVPQGGHTGHVGGAVPDETGDQIVVSLERMNRIREVDLSNNVMICEAGCILETIQALADTHDRFFPLALGSQGSCQIGGNIATNAGGTGVLAYGNTRQLVMGLEVVLPSGEIWDGLISLKKDNSGYDLKNLFIGAEGSLGIVTAAVLKLFPKPRGRAVAFCGLETPHQALDLFLELDRAADSALTAFELMARTPVEFTVKHIHGVKLPLENVYPWHALIEVSSSRSEADAMSLLQPVLESALETGNLSDASLATSIAQQREFWHLRETMPLAQKYEGGSMKHDVSVSVGKMPEFLARAEKIISHTIPDARVCAFGHMGDGNIHFNISQPREADGVAFLQRQPEINALVHALVIEMGGSVAAEHGVGRLKRELVAKTKDPTEIRLMKTIKKSLDPLGIMNPGKLV